MTNSDYSDKGSSRATSVHSSETGLAAGIQTVYFGTPTQPADSRYRVLNAYLRGEQELSREKVEAILYRGTEFPDWSFVFPDPESNTSAAPGAKSKMISKGGETATLLSCSPMFIGEHCFAPEIPTKADFGGVQSCSLTPHLSWKEWIQRTVLGKQDDIGRIRCDRTAKYGWCGTMRMQGFIHFELLGKNTTYRWEDEMLKSQAFFKTYWLVDRSCETLRLILHSSDGDVLAAYEECELPGDKVVVREHAKRKELEPSTQTHVGRLEIYKSELTQSDTVGNMYLGRTMPIRQMVFTALALAQKMRV